MDGFSISWKFWGIQLTSNCLSAKVFDTVVHSNLFSKSVSNGFHGIILNVLKNYLGDSVQHTSIYGICTVAYKNYKSLLKFKGVYHACYLNEEVV